MNDIHKEAFKVEVGELLSDLEISLIELENDSSNKEIIGKIFRALHTIKGSAGMFGYDDISVFTHDIETVFDFIRNGELEVSKQIIDLTLLAKDQIKRMLDETEIVKLTDDEAIKEIIQVFRQIVSEHKQKSEEVHPVKVQKNESLQNSKETYHVCFKPHSHVLRSGFNPIGLIEEMKQLGEAAVYANLDRLPAIEEMESDLNYLSWDIILSTSKGLNALRDVFIFVESDSDIEINKVELPNDLDLMELQNNSENLNWINGKLDLSSLKNSPEIIKDITQTVNEQSIKKYNEKQQEKISSIRVSSNKLDSLVNLVGELVTVQARLTQIASKNTDPELTLLSEEVERLTWDLRDSALNIRMLPIGSTFNNFTRLVRDLSKQLDKEILLVTEGGDTELDKNVIEKLNDPLVHIIRNCIDHGIEDAVVRKSKGKNAQGVVGLSALHSGTHVVIKISDDGAGLNKDAIISKALSKGLIQPDTELSEKEIFSLIFHPGFSTAQNVTKISGRGVGMDVVKKAVEDLRGTIEVTSQKDKGTTIELKLPLTLAIIEGLLVSIAHEYYVIPLSLVEECIEFNSRQRRNRQNLISVRGELIPYIKLYEIFGIEHQIPEITQIVIVNINSGRIGLVVDNVIGEHQTVIKPLGQYFKSVEIVSGATILGDGTIALLIDVPALLFKTEKEEESMINNNNGVNNE